MRFLSFVALSIASFTAFAQADFQKKLQRQIPENLPGLHGSLMELVYL